jgi:hypothetical protein
MTVTCPFMLFPRVSHDSRAHIAQGRGHITLCSNTIPSCLIAIPPRPPRPPVSFPATLMLAEHKAVWCACACALLRDATDGAETKLSCEQ